MSFSGIWTDITTCIDRKQTCPHISGYNRPIHRSKSHQNDVVPSLCTCPWFPIISIRRMEMMDGWHPSMEDTTYQIRLDFSVGV
ncbi:hypothetical protein L596_001333 [Steinernema carpocapsae]|uniref:Uncharacterized protein n=1 Tax=Steinernema carpocapsae TaxID=34508 RepID=A0A4U8ULG5_STECR|nr:hypothetical protein L596_001333 [Steinernema carpocapsae]